LFDEICKEPPIETLSQKEWTFVRQNLDFYRSDKNFEVDEQNFILEFLKYEICKVQGTFCSKGKILFVFKKILYFFRFVKFFVIEGL